MGGGFLDSVPDGVTPNASQVKLLKTIDQSFEDGHKFIVCNAPTGSGKSFISKTIGNVAEQPTKEFRDLINLLVSEGKTVVLTTHLLGDVDQVAKKIMLINKGKLVIKSSVADLFKELDLSSQMYIELADPTKENDAIVALEKAGANDISVKGAWLEMGIDPSNKLDVLNN